LFSLSARICWCPFLGKWLRKRARPIKKMANQVKSKYARTRMRYDNVQKAKVKSQLENKQRQLVNKSHTFDWIILAYLVIAGHEHYDALIFFLWGLVVCGLPWCRNRRMRCFIGFGWCSNCIICLL
jgi:hypothetical protein